MTSTMNDRRSVNSFPLASPELPWRASLRSLDGASRRGSATSPLSLVVVLSVVLLRPGSAEESVGVSSRVDVDPDDVTTVVDSVGRSGADSIWMIDWKIEASVPEEKAMHLVRAVDESSNHMTFIVQAEGLCGCRPRNIECDQRPLIKQETMINADAVYIESGDHSAVIDAGCLGAVQCRRRDKNLRKHSTVDGKYVRTIDSAGISEVTGGLMAVVPAEQLGEGRAREV